MATVSGSSPKTIIEHMIPHVGLASITLYPPADKVYYWLKRNNEIARLKSMRHLGALSYALPGARHARFDYTLALAYYAQRMDLPGMKTTFKIGKVEFSSAQAALQSIALMWNIGHLPGTFSVEKGVYRYLHKKNSRYPAAELTWPNISSGEIQRIRARANEFLKSHDYMGLSRVLAVIKLLSTSYGGDRTLKEMVHKFAAPFLLEYEGSDSKQWYKIRKAFNVVRHLSYLTLDTTLTGLQWCNSIPLLMRQLLEHEGADLEYLSDCVCEILSPVERLTYASLYHRDIARQEAAIVSSWVYDFLISCASPQSSIKDWMTKGVFQDLKIKRKPRIKSVNLAGTISLRTHFSNPSHSPVEIEALLMNKRLDAPLVLEYKAWNSDVLIEPDALIIDAYTKGKADCDDTGRLLAWMIEEFENPKATPNDRYELLRKADLEGAYFSLVKHAFKIALPSYDVKFDPWPMGRYSIFPNMAPDQGRGGIWAANAELDDNITKHILRNREAKIPSGLKDKYSELMGINKLRSYLRPKWAGKGLRQRCLLITSSVRLTQGKDDKMEFDGGIVVVKSRGGSITWYGLESKRGKDCPLRSLDERLTSLSIKAITIKLSSRFAFAKMELSSNMEAKNILTSP